MKKYKIRNVKDKAESYYIKKNQLFDVPFRVAIIGRSQQGKGVVGVNLLASPDYYKDTFLPKNIFVISGSARTDNKLKRMIRALKIPPENVMTEYDEDLLKGIYEIIEDDYEAKVEKKKKPDQYLFYIDDIGFSGKLRGKKK